MRITCVIGTLSGGGAERVMTYLAGGLAARGHEVTLLTLDTSIPDFYSTPENVTRVRIHLPPFKSVGFLGSFLRLWDMTRALWQTKPDVVISFMSVNVLAACFLLRKKYIFADHLDVRQLPFSRKWKILRNWLLGHAFAVAVLSQRDRKFIALYHKNWRPAVIYNPALPMPKDPLPRPDFMRKDTSYIIAVGRLVSQKGFDRLLKAWRRVCADFPSWRLAIIGAGPDEAELKDLAHTLNVNHGVDFIAPVKNLPAVYQHAKIYAMSSRAEGFPMVLLEAMASGLPTVSFNCTGPDVIIRDGIDGFLVKQNDTHHLAKKLAELMQNDALREELGANARQVVERFSLTNYLDAYENLCKEACQK